MNRWVRGTDIKTHLKVGDSKEDGSLGTIKFRGEWILGHREENSKENGSLGTVKKVQRRMDLWVH